MNRVTRQSRGLVTHITSRSRCQSMMSYAGVDPTDVRCSADIKRPLECYISHCPHNEAWSSLSIGSLAVDAGHSTDDVMSLGEH